MKRLKNAGVVVKQLIICNVILAIGLYVFNFDFKTEAHAVMSITVLMTLSNQELLANIANLVIIVSIGLITITLCFTATGVALQKMGGKSIQDATLAHALFGLLMFPSLSLVTFYIYPYFFIMFSLLIIKSVDTQNRIKV